MSRRASPHGGLRGNSYQSLKSPLCLCTSITLPDVIVNRESRHHGESARTEWRSLPLAAS